MERLAETYSKNGMNYRLVKRNERVALYGQYMPGGLLVGYEVFLIRVQPAFTFPNGIVNPEKEAFPGNEAFGRTAWAYNSLEMAELKYNELLVTERRRRGRGRRRLSGIF